MNRTSGWERMAACGRRCVGGACSALVLATLIGAAPVLADSRCARVDNSGGYGPYDYRLRNGETRVNLELVEQAHFTREQVRSAMQGSTDSQMTREARGSLDYTLRAFPNHAKALFLMAVWQHLVEQNSPDYFRDMQTRPGYSPTKCYFERAFRLYPDDPNVYNALGMFQSRVGEHDAAIKSFKRAVDMAPESSSAHYNLGLAYFAAGQFDRSAASARSAYRLGYKRQELKQRLKAKGHWE